MPCGFSPEAANPRVISVKASRGTITRPKKRDLAWPVCKDVIDICMHSGFVTAVKKKLRHGDLVWGGGVGIKPILSTSRENKTYFIYLTGK